MDDWKSHEKFIDSLPMDEQSVYFDALENALKKYDLNTLGGLTRAQYVAIISLKNYVLHKKSVQSSNVYKSDIQQEASRNGNVFDGWHFGGEWKSQFK